MSKRIVSQVIFVYSCCVIACKKNNIAPEPDINTGYGQTTLSLQPADNPDEYYLGTLASFGGAAILCAENWTVSGTRMNLRALLKFDLSSIPNHSQVKIISAKLSLYSHPKPTDGNLVDANYGSNNTMLIQRVTASWNKSTTWANQPAATSADQLVVPHTNASKLDLVNLDVTALVQAMMTNGNHGFLLRLQDESILYNCRLFCSSFYTEASKRPAITIVYEGK